MPYKPHSKRHRRVQFEAAVSIIVKSIVCNQIECYDILCSVGWPSMLQLCGNISDLG
jgi:hypothetical protein